MEIVEGHDVLRHAAAASARYRTIYLPHVDDDTSYAVGLHELGHLVAPNGMLGAGVVQRDIRCETVLPMERYDALQGEMAAWAWAASVALEWTCGMEQVRQITLDTYVRTVQLVQAGVLAGLSDRWWYGEPERPQVRNRCADGHVVRQAGCAYCILVFGR